MSTYYEFISAWKETQSIPSMVAKRKEVVLASSTRNWLHQSGSGNNFLLAQCLKHRWHFINQKQCITHDVATSFLYSSVCSVRWYFEMNARNGTLNIEWIKWIFSQFNSESVFTCDCSQMEVSPVEWNIAGRITDGNMVFISDPIRPSKQSHFKYLQLYVSLLIFNLWIHCMFFFQLSGIMFNKQNKSSNKINSFKVKQPKYECDHLLKIVLKDLYTRSEINNYYIL